MNKEDTSGNEGFDNFAKTRFVQRGDKVTLLPDQLEGHFSVSMTPEQAEFLSRLILALAREARTVRGQKYPDLYPDDAEGGTSLDRAIAAQQTGE